MKRPFVSLRSEITRSHALLLMGWLADEQVTQYLTDSTNVARHIEQVVDRSMMPILTPLFNQGGRFFMAHDRDDIPIGFVRLIKSGAECEIVLAVGDHCTWGRSLGASTIRESLKLAFFDMRAKSVIAKIHPQNNRSLNAFKRCGFAFERETPDLVSFSMSFGQYLSHLREGSDGRDDIYVTGVDQDRLQGLIEIEQGPATVNLEHEIERAIVTNPERVAADVVTMNSKVLLHLGQESKEVALVYPGDADERTGNLSILSDIGAAILGYREGDAIDWMVSDRPQSILIERVLYQPESSGHFHL